MIGEIGLMRVELPNRTVRLTDGGWINFDGDLYEGKDDVLGVIGSIGNLTGGRSGSITTLNISFNIEGSFSIAALTAGALQNGEVILWWGQYTVETGQLFGVPRRLIQGQIDQPVAHIDNDKFTISMSAASRDQKLFSKNTASIFSPSMHKTYWPGEGGHDQGTNLSISTAWGTESPTGAYSSGGSGGIEGGVSHYSLLPVER